MDQGSSDVPSEASQRGIEDEDLGSSGVPWDHRQVTEDEELGSWREVRGSSGVPSGLRRAIGVSGQGHAWETRDGDTEPYQVCPEEGALLGNRREAS